MDIILEHGSAHFAEKPRGYSRWHSEARERRAFYQVEKICGSLHVPFDISRISRAVEFVFAALGRDILWEKHFPSSTRPHTHNTITIWATSVFFVHIIHCRWELKYFIPKPNKFPLQNDSQYMHKHDLSLSYFLKPDPSLPSLRDFGCSFCGCETQNSARASYVPYKCSHKSKIR